MNTAAAVQSFIYSRRSLNRRPTTIKMKIYGDVGIVAYDPVEDKLQCHLCGKWFRGLGGHVIWAHGWTADDYREEFGLNKQQALICEGTREKLRRINRELGQWKHLISQTMPKTELLEFLKGIHLAPGYHLRQQALILKSERLKTNNPMDNLQSLERRTATLHKSWYGSERMRSVSRSNILATIAKLRERNLEERRWTCPCGQAFPTSDEAYHHRRHCTIARQNKIEKAVKARKRWWERASPEIKEQHRRHVSEGKKRQFASAALLNT